MSTPEGWEAVIGLEIHVQLATSSKIFCASPTADGAPPNTHVEPVTLGMPGVLPVVNREVVEMALKVGLALGCDIDRRSRFARKHYFYPDLPKGYQISQYEEPICSGGGVWAEVDGEERFFPLTRIHLEEDAGKTVHDPVRDRSLVDYNRAGVPLIETVSEPDLRSAEEAVAYMKALHQVVVALGVCDGNMERGNFRCDANVSVRPVGQEAFGTRVELKNINSFRFVGRGIAYEIERQVAVLEDGGRVEQETRLWDEQASMSRVLRGKEDAHDYRYFPDPDLITLEIDEDWIERVKETLPELPRARRKRYETEMGLSPYDAGVLTQSAELSAYFEAVCVRVPDPKLVANWVQGELLSWLNRQEREIQESPVSADALGEMLELVQSGEISSKMAKACFAAMADDGVSPAHWLKSHGGQITDEGEIETVVSGVLDAHPDQVASYLEGKTKIMGFLVGQVMRATGGKANPQMVNQVAARLMEERR